ncbi:MAG: TIGR02300 family protein [Rhizobiaceae bacterium]|nr:TIGR02300 family protein [Rhizobiaceae bacterium]MCV0405997.1 TIGR02300 family protein [Rhizobiaceae bacterium]
MAKAELGTKRIDPETGRKFYDLNKDPVVSPYTGKSYPRSYFESGSSSVEDEEEVEDTELEADEAGPEVVSLEEADEESKSDSDVPDLDDDVDLDDDSDDDDTFLADDEDDDDDVSDIIDVSEDDED